MASPPTGILFYEGRAKPLSTTGAIQPGAYYLFFLTGTTTPTPVYADGNLTTPLSQTPGTGGTTAASDGRLVPIYMDSTITYRVQLYSAQNVLLEDIDPYVPFLLPSQAQLAQIFYPRTATEITAGVTPVNFTFPPLYPERYGNNTTPGVTSMTTAFQNAINVAKKGGGTIWVGAGPYLLDTRGLDLTFAVGSQNCNFAIIGIGRYKAATFTQGTTQTPSIILKHTDNAAFDATGNLGVHFENLSICTDASTYPQTCFLLARNTDGASRSDRIQNCYVAGLFHKTILYNYGAEDGMYSGNQWYNFASDSDTSVFDITSNNIRHITSSFTTIATGVQSTLDHKIFGGEYANLFQGSGTTADVFRLEGGRQVKVYGIWIDSSSKSGTSSGRSLFYIDGTNGPQQGLFLHDIDGEAATFSAQYGIFVSANAQTHSNWVFEGCWFPTTTSMLGGGTGATVSGLTWINTISASAGPSIIFNGALVNAYLDGSVGTVAAGSIDVFANSHYSSLLVQNQGSSVINIRDYSQAGGTQWKMLRAAGGNLVVSAGSDAGSVIANNVQWLSNGSTQQLGKFYPVKDDGTAQAIAGIYAGSGVPSNTNGSNGDFYFRGDTPGTSGQRIYIRSAGAWVALTV